SRMRWPCADLAESVTRILPRDAVVMHRPSRSRADGLVRFNGPSNHLRRSFSGRAPALEGRRARATITAASTAFARFDDGLSTGCQHEAEHYRPRSRRGGAWDNPATSTCNGKPLTFLPK